MGCDGGTIPTRDELVKTKKNPEQKDKEVELAFRWCNCALSQEALRKPIVACGLGRLYNKDTILEKLLEKSFPSDITHIKSLKDIKDVRLTINPAYNSKNRAFQHHSEYICPITGLEMDGKYGFCLLWTCGCVLSDRALKEIQDGICPVCQKIYSKEDVVILNCTNDDDLLKMSLRLESRRRKLSKKCAQKMQIENSVADLDEIKMENDDPKKKKLKKSKDVKETDVQQIGKGSKDSIRIADPAYKKSASDYAINKDPNATEVYKSLFTTHSDAKTATKAHWVTYNPFYN